VVAVTTSAPVTVSAAQFAALFPFHIAFDSALRVTKLGASHARLQPALQVNDHLPSLLTLERPIGPFDHATITRHIDTLFIARRHDGLRLRGQMVELDDGAAVFLCSPWLPDPGGLLRWGLTLNDFPLHDAIPELVQVVQSQRIAVADLQRLTGRLRQQREELRAAVQQAELANRAKTHFLANVSHELRTPLNTILGMTSLLADAGFDDDSQELVHTVAASAEALLNSVGDLLDISKIETGELTFAAAEIDVASLAAEALDIVRTHVASAVLLALVTPRSSLRVSGDPHRLRQVLVALLKHALAFTAAGHVRVDVGWLFTADRQAIVEFAVEDTGPDVHSAERIRLFEVFGQPSSSPRPAGSLGLGLDTARALVEAMGGSIAVDSDAHRAIGCRFLVKLSLPVVNVGPEVGAMAGTVMVVAAESDASIIAAVCAAAGVQTEHVAATDIERAAARVAAIIIDTGGAADDGDVGLSPAVATPVLRLRRGGGGSWSHRERRLDGPLTPTKVRRALGERQDRQRPAMVQLGLRVLLVDDNPDGERYARMVLERAGCQVTSAATADEALLKATQAPCDVVLMDINLPDGSGIDALLALRASERLEGRARTPIICLTAHALRAFRDEAMAAGADDYVTKPVRAATLVDAVARAGGVDLTKAPNAVVAAPIVDVDPDLADLIDGYLDKARERVVTIEAALAEGRLEHIRQLGHNLRGTGAMYGFEHITDLGEALEGAVLSADIEAIRRATTALNSYLGAVRWRARDTAT
jgi:signal transduction histidine kinase/CheY-like chemotaxis protein/HPt (histidine-containing phosphotransfer) domain-containing protein